MLSGQSQATRTQGLAEIKVACVTLILLPWMYMLVQNLLINGKYWGGFCFLVFGSLPEETHL